MAESNYPYDTSVVRRLLKKKRKTRTIRSCFPCRHRKVRCSGEVPCTSCIQRNHVDLCRMPTSSSSDHDEQLAEPAALAAPIPLDSATTISDMKESSSSMIARLESIEQQIGILKNDLIRSQGAEKHTILHVDSTASLPVPADTPVADAETRHKSPGRRFFEDSTGASIYLGSHSDFPLALGCRESQAPWEDLFSEAMMDRCIPRAYPFTNLWGPEATAQDVCRSLPGDADILLYWQSFQTYVHPFYPVLVDGDEFGQELMNFLRYRKLRNQEEGPDRISQEQLSELKPSWIALLFVVIACGVQFADDPIQEKDLLSKVLICSSFQCLRLSDFFGQTNMDHVQTLALIGHCLRNNLDANTAWIIMGATIRLAQSIGLHEIWPVSSPIEQRQKSRLWWTLVWQDCFLSFTYDRPPSHSLGRICDLPPPKDPNGLAFEDCVFRICQLTLDQLSLTTPEQAFRVQLQFDNISESAAPFLTNATRCTSFQQQLERLAFQIHLGYAICRMYRIHLDQYSRQNTAITEDCQKRAKLVIAAFLDLHRLSKAVCRSWAFVHNAVSAAITLHYLRPYINKGNGEDISSSNDSDTLVGKLISVLQRESEQSQWRDTDDNIRHFGPFSRALNALEETYRK